MEPTIDSDRVMLTLCRARWRLVLQGVGGAPGEETIMRVGHVLPILAVGVACGAGVALASHPQVDPNTVPVGFLTAHSTVNRIPAPVIARAFRSGKADVFIEHARLAPTEAVDFHVHPGPSFITVQGGSLRYEEAAGGRCLRKSFGQGRGFVDASSPEHPEPITTRSTCSPAGPDRTSRKPRHQPNAGSHERTLISAGELRSRAVQVVDIEPEQLSQLARVLKRSLAAGVLQAFAGTPHAGVLASVLATAEDQHLDDVAVAAEVKDGLDRWWQQARRDGAPAPMATDTVPAEENSRVQQLEYVRQRVAERTALPVAEAPEGRPEGTAS